MNELIKARFLAPELKKVAELFLLAPRRNVGWSRGIAARMLEFGTRWSWVVNLKPRTLTPRPPRRKWTVVPIVHEVWWAQERCGLDGSGQDYCTCRNSCCSVSYL